jgi:predicted nucleic acid-binding protein
VSAFVVDCSLTVAWVYREEMTDHAQGVLDSLTTGQAFAPWLWPLEVANVLLVGERRSRLSEAGSRRFLTMLRALPISVESVGSDRVWDDVLPLARETGLTVYDAAYLDLAMRLGLPLATLNEQLADAASAVGVAVL